MGWRWGLERLLGASSPRLKALASIASTRTSQEQGMHLYYILHSYLVGGPGSPDLYHSGTWKIHFWWGGSSDTPPDGSGKTFEIHLWS